MKMTKRRAVAVPAFLPVLAIGLLFPAACLAASATALVSATVLGPAQIEIASGAVSVSRVSDLEFGSLPAPPSGALRVSSRGPATYRVRGGYHADYRIVLPERVTLTDGESRIEVSGFRIGGARCGSLASDGTGAFELGASATIPAGRPAGTYWGTYPITVAYD